MTYTTLQTILDYAAIAPCLIAVALLVSHLVHCWQLPTMPEQLEQVEEDPAIAELLEIPASVSPLELPAVALPAIAKLYSVHGSSKWSNTRKLRKSEREMVLNAIFCNA